MNCHFPGHTVLISAIIFSLAGAAARADDTPQQSRQQQEKRAIDAHNANLKGLQLQQEIDAQPQGIHKISDGGICIKSGPGTAVVYGEGKGCKTGCNGRVAPAVPDGDLLMGILFGVFSDPKQGTILGITPEQSKKIREVYFHVDNEATNPSVILKVYEPYAKAPEGKAKEDAGKVLMDKVRDVGQAYIDADARKLKDLKALLTPTQLGGLRAIGAHVLRPAEKIDA